jgi:predicted RNA-binding Zn-ribbon protein involved in translation (DUF1610 family)
MEDLNIKGLAAGMLAKSVHNAAWNQLVQHIGYNAECAGSTLKLVDPRGTSQTCPECGTIRCKTLAERRHTCDCGYHADRDVAAARIVLMRANFGPGAGFRRQASGLPHSLPEKPSAEADGAFTTPLARLGRGFLPDWLNRAKGVVAMNHQAFWNFHCPECGVGNYELGHSLSAEEIYCIVCLDETERRVRLHRWEVVEIPTNLAA